MPFLWPGSGQSGIIQLRTTRLQQSRACNIRKTVRRTLVCFANADHVEIKSLTTVNQVHLFTYSCPKEEIDGVNQYLLSYTPFYKSVLVLPLFPCRWMLHLYHGSRGQETPRSSTSTRRKRSRSRSRRSASKSLPTSEPPPFLFSTSLPPGAGLFCSSSIVNGRTKITLFQCLDKLFFFCSLCDLLLYVQKKQKRYDGEKDARIAMYRNCYSIMREFKMQKMKFNRFKKYEDMNLWNSFVKKPFYSAITLCVCQRAHAGG